MTVGLDSSIVVRLLIGEPVEQAKKAYAWTQDTLARGGRIIVSDLVISEVYFALQSHYGIPKEEALDFLREWLINSGVTPTGQAGTVLRQSTGSGNPGFVDRLIHAEYSSRNATLLTFEKAARKLGGVEVL